MVEMQKIAGNNPCLARQLARQCIIAHANRYTGFLVGVRSGA